MYRDASNYKFWGNFHVLGPLCLDDLETHLFDSEFFIPERIGLHSLVPEMKSADDHLLHEFAEIQPGNEERYLFKAEELLERLALANAEDWFAGIN